jgi:hypothetical protein
VKKRFELQQLILDQQVPHSFKDGFRGFAKAFLIHLTPRVKDDGSCFDSYENILRVLGCSRPTLTKITAYWRDEGIMAWEKGTANQHGERKASVYHFDEAAMQERLKTQVARETDTFPKQPNVERLQLKLAGKQIGFPSTTQPVEDIQPSPETIERGRETDTFPKQKVARETDIFPAYKPTQEHLQHIDTRSTVLEHVSTNDYAFSKNQEPAPQAVASPQNETYNEAPLTLSKDIPALPQKPSIAKLEAQQIVKRMRNDGDMLVCERCNEPGNFDFTDDDDKCFGKAADGSRCSGSGLTPEAWLEHINSQWENYSRHVAASTGLSLAEMVGRLDVPSMERQKEITSCRVHANTLNIAERRTWAKELYASANRWKVRKAWYLYASGMLDDSGETEPWVTQLFADLEALAPRDGETK